MTLSWTSAIRDRVSQLVLGLVYSGARSDEKNLIDAAGSVPTSSPAGLAGERLTVVRQWAQWFEQLGAGASAGPDLWEHVWVREIAAHAALGLRRNDIRPFFEALDDAWETALNSYSVADASSATLNDQSVTPKMLRFHVIRHCARLTTTTGRKRRLLVPVPDIDAAINWTINFLWHRTHWEFRTRQVQLTLDTASPESVTDDLPTGEEIDAITSRWLVFDANADSGINNDMRCVYADETTMARLKAADPEDGRPTHFHVEDRGNNTRYWHWSPTPDAAYTLRGACTIIRPALPSDANDTTPFTKFPPEFVTLFPDVVLAYILKKFRVEGWQDTWKDAMDLVEQVAPDFDASGAPSMEGLQATDAYEDWRRERGFGGGGI